MTNANEEIISSIIVQPGGHAAGRLEIGQRIQVIDLEGKQVCDFVCYNADNLNEVSDMVTTCLEQDSWRLSEGKAIYSDYVRPMLRITDDKVGVHGYTGGACTHEINKAAGVDQPGCTEAMCQGFAKLGYPQLGAPRMAALNIFQPPLTQPDGSFHPLEPLSKAGDYLEMTAEMPLLWALSCCPYPGPINGFGPTPVEVRILPAS
ncbi:urea carboxylase-associated family protein [Rhizobium sp. Root1204]|uniref:DUF1989 domain-containing protein n=1 Tax=Rhizobium sp. Root1204 TaxID=1736428 RepID=UPI00071408FF|nr:urea carboxylase-associated family protein [Rhizobium sp. Root1204]KQV41327.1 hypothetical protein ASC96_18725 [Rhizobium sp. Root1204]